MMNWADFRRAALRASAFVALGGVSPADAIEAAAQASQRTLIASPAQVAQAADEAGASSGEAPATSTDQNEPSVPEVPADPAGANLPDVIVTPDVTKPATATPKSRPTPVSTTPRPRTTPAASTVPTESAGVNVPDETGEQAESTTPPPTGTIGAPPAPFAGGQVATGGQVGLLGNRDIFDTPYSLTSYTAEAIENQQATTMGAVLENNPSVRSISAGAMWDTFMIRGFQVSSSGYSLNGLPGIAPGSMVAPEFIDRAELFLGPTGMLSNMPLYGATGGAVNLVTKKANDKPLTALTTGFLSDGQSATHLDVGRRYGLNKEWGIRVNGVYRDGDTAFDNQQEMLGLATAAIDYHGKRVRTSLDIGYQAQD
jgi:iron complex outermembrane receptor protein